MISEKNRQLWLAVAQERQRCRTDLFYLCHVIGYNDVCREVHGELIDKLQHFDGGKDELMSDGSIRYTPFKSLWDLEGKRKRLFLDPRGHLKTTILTQAHTLQWVLNYPDVRILITTATGDLAQKVLRAIKSIFQYNEVFRSAFPDFCPQSDKAGEWGNMESFTVPNRKDTTLREPTVSTSSIGRAIAGSHYEVLKCCDMVDKENVKTPGGIQEVIEHFRYMDPLLERHQAKAGMSNKGWTDVEGTRYDFGDLYGWIIDNDSEDIADNERWQIHRRSAEVDPQNKVTLWPARFPWEELKSMERNMGPGLYCFPAGTPVLMADWSERSIENIEIGDEVVGYEFEDGPVKLVRTKVANKNSRTMPVVEITMDSGQVIYCTPEHKWWNPKYKRASSYGKRQPYYEATRVGRTLCRVYKHYPSPTASEQRMWDWLGGIFDGEGSCATAGTPSIAQSGSNPEVCARIESVLKWIDIPYSIWSQKPKNPKWSEKRMYQLREARSTIVRLLTHAAMVKRERFTDRCWKRSNRISENDGRDKVLLVRQLGEQQVFNITTETGNYVAWGYATKNSAQMLNHPVPSSGGLATLDDIKDQWIPRRVISEMVPKMNLHCTVDMAAMDTTKTGGDFTVLTVAGFDKQGKMYVVDIRRGHFNETEAMDQFYLLARLYPTLLDFKIQKDAYGRTLAAFLKREQHRRGWLPPIVEMPIDNTRSKEQRIRGLQPWFKAKLIYFAADLPCRTDLFQEITRFPSRGVHDDILDTLADQLQNREGGVNLDVVPAPWEPQFGKQYGDPDHDRFVEFDPITREAKFLSDMVGSVSNCYDANGI